MKPVNIQRAARKDLEEAAAWYDQKLPGLGDELLSELLAAAERIARNPQLYARAEGDARRTLLHRFPYHAVFVEEAESIEIIALIHAHRNPEVWKRRIPRK